MIALSLLGFGGGLFLAFFCFNTPERPVTAAVQTREPMYPPPVSERSEPTQDAVASSAEQISSVRSDAPKLAVDPVDVSSPVSAPRKTADTESRKLEVVTSNGPAALPEMTAIFSAAEQLGEVGRGQIRGGSGGGGGIESAYDAFQLPMIPEPAAGPGIVVLLAAVIAARTLRQRRRVPAD